MGILQKAEALYAAGDYFPVFGHCQGFEVLAMAITGLNREDCMTNDPKYKAENVSLSLNFVAAPNATHWFADFPQSVLDTLSLQNSTLNNHQWSMPPALFAKLQETTSLKNYRITSTTVGPAGGEFVSTFESTTFPMYVMQFHAEKSIFEWPHENIDHSVQAVAAMGHMAQFMGSEVRKSLHAFPTEEDANRALIYNYCPKFSIDFSSFDQIYFFE